MNFDLDDLMMWYDNYELQVTEEEVIHELSYDEKGNKKDLPSSKVIRKKVLKRIAERRKENGI